MAHLFAMSLEAKDLREPIKMATTVMGRAPKPVAKAQDFWIPMNLL